MQSVSNFDNLSRIELIVYRNSTDLGMDIISASYESSCNGGDIFGLGNACAAQITIQAYGDYTSYLGDEVSAAWRVYGSETEYDLMALGIITSAKVSAGQTELIISDPMYVYGGSLYDPSATVAEVSCTPADVYSDLCDKLGVDEDEDTADALGDLDETFSDGISAYWENMTIAECCGQLALLIGADAIISRSGAMVFKVPTEVSFSSTVYAGGGSLESEYAPDYVTVQTPEDDEGNTDEYTYPASATGEGLVLQSPFASDDLAERIYDAIPTAWSGGDYSIPGGWLLEPGDIIEVTTEDAEDQSIHCSMLTMSFDGGVKTSIRSAGRDDSGYGSVGSINNALSGIKVDIIEANKLIADKADIADVAIYKDDEGNAVINYDGALKFQSGQLVIDSSGLTLDSDGNAVFSGTLEAASGSIKSLISTLVVDYDTSVTQQTIRRVSNNPNYFLTFAVSSATAAEIAQSEDITFDVELTTSLGDDAAFVVDYGEYYNSKGFDAEWKISSGLNLFDYFIPIKSPTNAWAWEYSQNGEKIFLWIPIVWQDVTTGTIYDIGDEDALSARVLEVCKSLGAPDTMVGEISGETVEISGWMITFSNNIILPIRMYVECEKVEINEDGITVYDETTHDPVITLDDTAAEFDVPVTVDEDMEVTGSLTLEGHSSAIGTEVSASATSITLTTATWGTICSISLDAGVWIIPFNIAFDDTSSTTGNRMYGLFTNETTTAWQRDNFGMLAPAPTNSRTQHQGCFFAAPTETTTYYLRAYQTSGSDVNASGRLHAIRIA